MSYLDLATISWTWFIKLSAAPLLAEQETEVLANPELALDNRRPVSSMKRPVGDLSDWQLLQSLEPAK